MTNKAILDNPQYVLPFAHYVFCFSRDCRVDLWVIFMGILRQMFLLFLENESIKNVDRVALGKSFYAFHDCSIVFLPSHASCFVFSRLFELLCG
jgi:hypothetical protein